MSFIGQNSPTIPKEKIVDYLLSASHRDGRHKAVFFLAHGFSADQWNLLAEALRKHANDHEIAKIEESPFGQRYVIEGEFETPDGRTPSVRSVWFIDTDSSTPRFVTAYPLEKRTL